MSLLVANEDIKLIEVIFFFYHAAADDLLPVFKCVIHRKKRDKISKRKYVWAAYFSIKPVRLLLKFNPNVSKHVIFCQKKKKKMQLAVY